MDQMSSEVFPVLQTALRMMMQEGQTIMVDRRSGFYCVQKIDNEIKVRPANGKEINSISSYDKIMDAMKSSIAC